MSVRPSSEVLNYRTDITGACDSLIAGYSDYQHCTGITPGDLDDAESFEQVQAKVPVQAPSIA